MKQAFKRMKHKLHQQPTGADRKKALKRNGPNWALLAVACVSAGLITYGLFEYVLLSRLPEAIVGTWVVEVPDTDEHAGMTIVFYRNGAVTTKLPKFDEAAGVARVENGRLNISIADRTGRSRERITDSYLLVTLTDSLMELEKEPQPVPDGPPRGMVLRLKRATTQP
jgi:hypothetical protein